MVTDNPVFHEFPTHPLPALQMHAELNKHVHAHCTLETCTMRRYCWLALIDLGHLHPSDTAQDCVTCRDPARRSDRAGGIH